MKEGGGGCMHPCYTHGPLFVVRGRQQGEEEEEAAGGGGRRRLQRKEEEDDILPHVRVCD